MTLLSPNRAFFFTSSNSFPVILAVFADNFQTTKPNGTDCPARCSYVSQRTSNMLSLHLNSIMSYHQCKRAYYINLRLQQPNHRIYNPHTKISVKVARFSEAAMCLHSCIVIEITRCILAQNKMFIMTSSTKSSLEDRTRVHNELLLQDWMEEGIAKQHFSTLDYCNRFSNSR